MRIGTHSSVESVWIRVSSVAAVLKFPEPHFGYIGNNLASRIVKPARNFAQ